MKNIKKVIITTVLFVVAFSIFSIAFMEIHFQGENYYYQDAKARNELAGTIDYFVIGASHIKRGLNPDILDARLGVTSYNLASPNLTMQGRYDLLKKELARNPVKTVVMDMSFDAIRQNRKVLGPEGEIYYLSRIDSLPERLKYAAVSLYPSEYVTVYNFFMNDTIDCFKRYREGKYRLRYDGKNNHKGYKAYDKDSPATDLTADFDYVSSYKTMVCAEQEADPDNAKYFQMIIDLCKSQDVELRIITVPVSVKTICAYTGYDHIREWYADTCAANDVTYIDFNLIMNRDELWSDTNSFKDDNHLWNSGAETFSNVYCDVMRMVDLGIDVSDLFYESYEAYEQTQSYYPANR